MRTERGLVMMQCGRGAAAAPGTVSDGSVSQAAVLLDEGPELSVLIAEVDAILCDAAATLLRPPPSPQLSGCALVAPPSSGRSYAVSVQAWSAPAPDVRAVQRSPPRATFAKNGDTAFKEGR